MPLAPLKESGAKPSFQSGTPLWGWAYTINLHLKWRLICEEFFELF